MLAERRRGKDVLEGGPSAGERVARGGPEAPDKRTRRPPERSRCSHSARRGGRETQRAATPQPPSAAQMILIDPNRPRQQRPREHQEGRLFPGPPARRSPCPATGPRPTFPQGEGQQLVEPVMRGFVFLILDTDVATDASRQTLGTCLKCVCEIGRASCRERVSSPV